MNYIIKESVVTKSGLSMADFFFLSAIIENNRILDDLDIFLKTGMIIKNEQEDSYIVSKYYKDLIVKILLESDKSVPTIDRCTNLASAMREAFPKGVKSGSAVWRGNIREIALRLQKFFKLYGDNWTDEEIIAATKRYVESFKGDYTYMKILKYFILKAESRIDEEGKGYIEEVSNLANWLDNTEEENKPTDDWLTELK